MKLSLSLIILFISALCQAQLYKPLQKKIDKWIKETIAEADKGNIEAIGNLGNLYLTGDIPVKELSGYGSQLYSQVHDETKGLALLKKCDSLGSLICSYNLGYAYFYVTHDLDKALLYFEKAAKAGDEKAMFYTGQIYQYGKTTPGFSWRGTYSGTNDFAKAKQWYQNAAGKNYQPAIEKLQTIAIAEDNSFEKAMQAVTDKNYTLALKLWKANYETFRNNSAAYNIGMLYYKNYLEKDLDQARNWFQTAGDLGYAKGSYLAGILWNDMGDRGEAIKWWQTASRQGYKDADALIDKTNAQIASDTQRRESEAAAYNKKKTEEANRPIKTPDNTKVPTSTYKTYTPPVTDPYADSHNKSQKAIEKANNKPIH